LRREYRLQIDVLLVGRRWCHDHFDRRASSQRSPAIKPPLRLARQNELMSVIRFKRRARKGPPRFALVVLATAVAAFALTYWWPQLTTSSPIMALPTLDAAGSMGGNSMQEDTLGGDANSSAIVHDDRFACRVSSITDGDTLRCADGTRIRLHAVAAREMDESCSEGHPCPSASGASARAELQRLAGGRTLSCSRTGTSYDRVTAICWTSENQEINCAMILSGTAVRWDRFHLERPVCRPS
jgi:endonuclease YncB( thermonuclease family)